MINRPTHRRLRGYAFDPSISLDIETFDVNNIVYKTRWEETWGTAEQGNRSSPGPCGEHVEVVDFDRVAWEFGQLTGLVIQYWQDYGVPTSRGGPAFQVLDLHVVSRSGPDGGRVNQIVFGLVQRMGVVPAGGGKFENYVPGRSNSRSDTAPPDGGFEVQGGCTMIFDLDSLDLKYSITKPLLSADQIDEDGWPQINLQRVRSQHEYQQETLPLSMSEVARYFGAGLDSHFGEPFSLLHTKEPRNA